MVIFDGFSRGRRSADVRFCPVSAEPGRARSVAFGRTLVIRNPNWGLEACVMNSPILNGLP